MSEPDTSTALAATSDPLGLLRLAIERGVDADQLDRLLSLQERWEMNRAKERYALAVAAFQAEMPQVAKRREGHGYRYANFEDILTVAQPILTRHGITVDFSQREEGDFTVITMRLRVGIYFEDKETWFPRANLPAIVAQQKRINDVQAFAQVRSYLRRYTFCEGLNVVVAGEDNDAAGIVQTVGPQDLADIRRLLAEKRVDEAGQRFLGWLKKAVGVESLEAVPRGSAGKVRNMLLTLETPK